MVWGRKLRKRRRQEVKVAAVEKKEEKRRTAIVWGEEGRERQNKIGKRPLFQAYLQAGSVSPTAAVGIPSSLKSLV